MNAAASNLAYQQDQSTFALYDQGACDPSIMKLYDAWHEKTGDANAAATLVLATAIQAGQRASGALNSPAAGPTPASDGPFTVTQVARQLRASPDTIRGWIKGGQLSAANLATGPRPRYVITQDDLAAFLKRRQPQAPGKRQRRRPSDSSDRY
jgi:excisionase family DNA binding protein